MSFAKEWTVTSLTCAKCNGTIPSEEINVVKDIAFCRPCNAVYSVSDVIQAAQLRDGCDLEHPPSGAYLRGEGGEIRVGATMRTTGGFLILLAFAIFWNGCVAIFVIANLLATLVHLGVALPEDMKPPKLNGKPMTAEDTVFLWCFLTPFILIGLTLVATVFFAALGSVDVRINDKQGVVATGAGPFVWRRRFDRSNIKKVSIEKSRLNEDGLVIVLAMQTGPPLKFGSVLTPERIYFVAGALQRLVLG